MPNFYSRHCHMFRTKLDLHIGHETLKTGNQGFPHHFWPRSSILGSGKLYARVSKVSGRPGGIELKLDDFKQSS